MNAGALTGTSSGGAATARGSSTSTVPPAPFSRIASTGSTPKMWSPGGSQTGIWSALSECMTTDRRTTDRACAL